MKEQVYGIRYHGTWYGEFKTYQEGADWLKGEGWVFTGDSYQKTVAGKINFATVTIIAEHRTITDFPAR